MFSLFSNNKNKALEEEKIEQQMELPKNPLFSVAVKEDQLHFDRIKKSEIEKQILLKRRREPNISAENIQTSYKKRLTSKIKKNQWFYCFF